MAATRAFRLSCRPESLSKVIYTCHIIQRDLGDTLPPPGGSKPNSQDNNFLLFFFAPALFSRLVRC